MLNSVCAGMEKGPKTRPRGGSTRKVVPGNSASRSMKATMAHRTKLLNKVEIKVKTYPDLQPFLEMAVLLLEGVYEYMAEV